MSDTDKIDAPQPIIPATTTGSETQDSTASISASISNVSQANTNSYDFMSNLGTNTLGLLTNLALFTSGGAKFDYDENGNLVTGLDFKVQRKYRSIENGKRIKDAKERHKKMLEKQGINYEDYQKAIDQERRRIKFFNENDVQNMLRQTTMAIQSRILGPLINNWTNGEDFLAAIKYTLQNILTTLDPIVKLVEPIQKQIYGAIDVNAAINIPTASGKQLQLPLGMMALDALNRIVSYLTQLLRNIERIASEYTVKELNELFKYASNDKSQIGGPFYMIHDLINLILSCIKPYIQNLMMALIFDAIDVIVDVLKKAGILEPKGPLVLIPTAITLIRSICRGDLEAIQEMIEKTITKLLNIVQVIGIAFKDPSILWADLDQVDEKVYEAMTAAGITDAVYTSKIPSLGAGVRRYLEGIALDESRNAMFNNLINFAYEMTDLNGLYNRLKAKKQNVEKNEAIENAKAAQANSVTQELTKTTRETLKEFQNQ